MKRNKKINKCLIIVFIFCVLFSGEALGIDLELNTTKEFDNWINEKQDSIMPKSFDYEIPESILNNYKINKNVPNMLSDLLKISNRNFENISANYTDSSYNMANELNITVRNQGITNECWAISMLMSMETNYAKLNRIKNIPDFSERHMDYATSKTFLNGEINEKGFNREVGTGGLPIIALAYLTNGQGAVLEENMKFENNENKIHLSEINKTVDTIVTGYSILPTLTKKYDNSGKVSYYNNAGVQYSETEVKAIRNIIKDHIIKYGAVTAMTAATNEIYYNNSSSILKSTAYFCNDVNVLRDHAVTIVGWDDNYSRYNFNESCRPNSDGAYLVLNSYGEKSFNKGYLYISYEDVLIESELYGITSSKNKDYDKIYQYDNYGGIFPIGSSLTNTGYYANIYHRDNLQDEYINSVGLTVPSYTDVEIYINPSGKNMTMDSLVRIGSMNNLEPGYHRIDVTKTKLNGSDFAVVIKQISKDGKFYFSTETRFDGTSYSNVSSEGESYISFDCNEWKKLSEYKVLGIDVSKSDVCIKAFTIKSNNENPIDNNELDLGNYILHDNYIMNITFNTKRNIFLSNIKTDSEIKILKQNNEEILENEIIKTGYKMILNDNQEYIIIVRGDINCDGNVSLTDLSKLIMHYNEVKGYILTGYQEKGADLNMDGKVSLVDLSQLIVLYNSFI